MSPFVSRLLPSAPDSCRDSCCQPADSCRDSCLLDRPGHGLAADVHSVCMVALPGQLFYSTQIPVCLWFLSRDKKNGLGGPAREFHDWKLREWIDVQSGDFGLRIEALRQAQAKKPSFIERLRKAGL